MFRRTGTTPEAQGHCYRKHRDGPSEVRVLIEYCHFTTYAITVARSRGKSLDLEVSDVKKSDTGGL